jgi:PAS domain S-box-containing protein
MSDHSLNVLIVEDWEDDMLLTLRELRRGGYSIHSLRVETEVEMRSALEQQRWDIVIADYTLPSFSAPAALKLLQQMHRDLPFIIVSGTIGEETAVEAMRSGAHDYIIKGNLARLLPAVERELREAQDRKKRHETERALRDSEAALRDSQQEYQALAEASPVGIFRMDAQGNCVYVNRQWCQMTGMLLEQALQQNWSRALHPEDTQLILATWQQALQAELPFRLEFRIQRPDRSIIWVFAQALPQHRNGTELLGYIGTMTDISDRKQAEQKIREQADLIDIASDAIFVRDLNNNITFWNRGAERLYGWTTAEVLGRNSDLKLSPKNTTTETEIFQAVIQQGEWQGELYRINQIGQEVIVATRCTLVRDDAGEARSILTVDTDVTEKKRLESQFLRAQRLESLGTLASGIAHDFNNILTPILGIAQLLPMRLPDLDDRNQQMLRIVADSAKRGAELVKQIVVFARGGDGKRIPLQISHLLSEIVQMAHQTFPKDIEIRANLNPQESWLVSADATHLHQVFMNLAVNARDAMPDGGILSFSSEQVVIDAAFAKRNLEAIPGDYLLITVSDTGTGIPTELLERIFEPFFTTKEVGKGTGLGLSTILGIVKNHEGFVKVCSEVGQGSQFKVYLPMIQYTAPGPIAQSSVLPGRNELILIVEDEPSIQQVLKISLEDCNYRTLTANNGLEAIAHYQAHQQDHQQDIQVVLMDMMMPTLDGLSAIQRIKALNPAVKVIAMSGLASNRQVVETIGDQTIKAFLPKPYTTQELLETLHRILHEPRSSDG